MVENARDRLLCPRCGDEMNRHAVKIDTTGVPDDGAPHEGFGGVLKEFHTCAGCRFVFDRPSP